MHEDIKPSDSSAERATAVSHHRALPPAEALLMRISDARVAFAMDPGGPKSAVEGMLVIEGWIRDYFSQYPLTDESHASSASSETSEPPTATLRLGDGTWHDGPGWYYVDDEYPDEGSCGAFATAEQAADHARAAGYQVTIPLETPEAT